MAAFKHACSILLLSILIIFVAGIEEGDFDGSLGWGRLFRGGGYGGPDRGLNYLGTAQSLEPEQCCAACKKNYPETEVINFLWMISSQNGESKYCTCKKRDLTSTKRPSTEAVFSWSGQCGNTQVEVDGGVGVNKAFLLNYVDVLGKAVEGSTDQCCTNCLAAYPTTLFSEQQYYLFGENKCVCLVKEPGTVPMTAWSAKYAGIC